MTQIITNSLPLGVPGDLSRQLAVVESFNMNTTLPVTSFGLPVKRGDAEPDTVTGIVGGDAAGEIIGFLVRQFPSQPGATNDNSFGPGTPAVSGPCSVMREGYMIVKKNGAAAAVNGGQVYVRIATPAPGSPVGGVEAAADGANTILATGAFFTGAADSEGNAEIRYNVGVGG